MINCFAITEEGNLAALAAHLEKYPLTKLVGSYTGSPLKYSEIVDLSVQMVFIDYSLVSIFRPLLTRLSQHVSIVYLSTDQSLAFQAFEAGALDFIAYPFDFNRLERSVNKLIRLSLLIASNPPLQKHVGNVDSFFVKPDPKGKVELLINCNDVLFIEAYQNDVAIQMADGRRYVCYHTMREMEDNLSNCFMRVHKSFIINYKKMSAFDGSNIIISTYQEFKIPLGGVYKKAFLDKRNTMVIRKPIKSLDSQLLRKALSYLLMFLVTELNVINEIIYI